MCPNVEKDPRGVLERQALGVALNPFDVETRARSLRLPGFEELRHQIDGRDLGSSSCGRQGRVAGAAGNVEHPHPRRNVGSIRQELAHARDLLTERRVIARCPHQALVAA